MKNEKLKNARKECGFTQRQLAAKVGVEVVTLRKWEDGTRSPFPESRNLLCEILEKTAAQLGLDDTDIPKGDLQEVASASVSPSTKSKDQNRLSMLKRVRST